MQTPAHREPSHYRTVTTPLFHRMSLVCNVLMFLYGTAYWMQKGVFPFLVKKLNISTEVYGYLETVYSLALLLSGPFFGQFGDRFGARSAMLACFVGSFAFYSITAMAEGAVGLLLSRLAGFLLHGMEASQMIMTDVTGPEERAGAFGKLSFYYSVGVIVGPSIGGWVSTALGEQTVAGVAALLMMVAIVIVVIGVPSKTKDPLKVAAASTETSNEYGSVFSLKAVLSLLTIPEVLGLISLKLLVAIPVGVFRVMFSFVNIDRFGLTVQTNGYILTYTGLLSAFTQAFGVQYFVKRFKSDLRFLLFMILVKAVAFLLLAWTSSVWCLIVALLPLTMSGALTGTVINKALTQAVPERATGTSLGISMASQSLIRTFSPTLGVWLYANFGYPSIGILGCLLNGGVALIICAYCTV